MRKSTTEKSTLELWPGFLTEEPVLPPFPLSREAQGDLFAALAGYAGWLFPEWAARLLISRLVSVPPWELHRCDPRWLDAAIELHRLEREAREHLLRKQDGAPGTPAGLEHLNEEAVSGAG